MSPGIFSEPEKSKELKQAYREGFEAGKRALKQELKELIRILDAKETHPTSTTTSKHTFFTHPK